MTSTGSPSVAETLRAFMDRAYNEHSDAPRAFADALAARAGALAADAEGAEAIRLAEHLMLGHLADPRALQAFIEALPAGLPQAELVAPSVQRAVWALAAVRGEPEPVLPALRRWASLQNAVLALSQLGHSARAQALLLRDEAEALAHEEAPARRNFAISANNTAQHLRLGARGDAARDALMVSAAGLSRRAWEKAGNWMNVERAEYELAMCHAVLGQGATAVQHGALCLQICEAEQADAVEHFFAHEALVHAHRAAGQADQGRHHRAQMVAWLPQVSDAEMRAWCAKTLETTPA